MIKFHAKSLYLVKSKLYLNTKLSKTSSRSYRLGYSIYKDETTKLSPSASEEKSTVIVQNFKQKPIEDWGEIVNRWYTKYQQFVGISEILEAQEKVTLFTNQLFEVQTKRRQLQREVETVHQQLLSIHQRITKSELYSEDHYCLFEKARELNGTLKSLQNEFTQAEDQERSLFTQLSTAIKYCHEKERTQSEQSKYWSILISVISASLASLITSINNWVRIKEIKEHASQLHKDTMEKTNQLHTIISNASSDEGNPHSSSISPESLIETIQSTVRNEVKKIVYSLNELPIEEKEHYLNTPQEVSYLKIAGSMFIGAALGIGITASFLGSSGGG